ncbi:DUF305 domain-containing protein [Nakamurella flavida]|uniref:DUF305 domain-containing protein n=1 Tax=Nakamurella flavida TaxID=363630 RepID=A0A938YNR2_9ACTN|nr:DUF305 domain-containing protein [Nakamurella flavida]MBM9477926.1 DUF305 domain-containing protein [Nakamurella flavida]MDP9778359.1 uncharacterized protein (DUF305 family) [Nakamurella flavida]
MSRAPRTVLTTLALTGVLALAACSGTDTTASTSSTTAAAPGSAAPATSDPADAPANGDTAEAAQDPLSHNDADVAFARAMVVHHQEAVAMADLVQGRTTNPAVLDLAGRIRAAQAPEIDVMNGWLATWGAAAGSTDTDTATDTAGGEMTGMDHSGMDMGGTDTTGTATSEVATDGGGMSGMAGMAGMMTPEQMAELTAATGADFDARWLELMIAHHRGAVTMAGVELESGVDSDALELARTIAETQATEIGEMEQLQNAG